MGENPVTGSADGYPSVPHDRLLADGWELRSKRERTVFRMPGMEVTGRTLLYDDADLRAAIEAAGVAAIVGDAEVDDRVGDDGDGGSWRFFFATALSFRPPLAPMVGTVSIRPTVARQARRTFVDELEGRGFEGVESGRRERVRTESGDRTRLRQFTAHLPIAAERGPERIDAEGWLAVWVTDGSFRIAGGAYPTHGLEARLDAVGVRTPRIDRVYLRDELIELIRAVR
ncbi:hypothetical protein [Natronomonas salsuginis]|uniref:hypothetical protein n=1 Tax=Natronomonas salsuginis TaxID=2217661 RepID=UPI001FEB75DC|nr:hypothetical protein [Natronomonas salsuginis]